LSHLAKKAVLRSEGIKEAAVSRFDEIIAIVCLGQSGLDSCKGASALTVQHALMITHSRAQPPSLFRILIGVVELEMALFLLLSLKMRL
jgi:hypothetical protein